MVDCFEHFGFWGITHTYNLELSVWWAGLINCLCSRVSRRKCNLFYKAFWYLVVWCVSQDEDVCVQYILSKFVKMVSAFRSRYSSSLCTGLVCLKITRLEDLSRVWGAEGFREQVWWAILWNLPRNKTIRVFLSFQLLLPSCVLLKKKQGTKLRKL